jgi:hypothetical protein
MTEPFVCPRCGAISHHLKDREYGYCGRCHAFTSSDRRMTEEPRDRGSSRDWLVWSYEHDAWWGPGRMGYVKDSRKAGRYTYEEAEAICAQANRFSEVVMEEARHVSTTNEPS